MTAELALQAVETLAVIVGVAFGLMQLRQLRLQREAQAGIELLRPLQTRESAEALLVVHGLPDNLTGEQLRERLGDEFQAVLATIALFESLGPLVARGHLPFDMYAESYRGPTVFCWRKLRRYIMEQRQSGWPALFEWLQWLAERLEDCAPPSVERPAFERFKNWREPGDYQRLRSGPAGRDQGLLQR